jgi:lauroyl/myristoyl acyltransferase
MSTPVGAPPPPPSSSPRPARVPLALRLERAIDRASFLLCRTLVRSLPYGSVRRLGYALGEARFRLSFRERPRIRRELESLLGRPPGDPATHARLRTAYRTSDAAMLEVLKLFDRPQDIDLLLSHAHVVGLDNVRRALEAGRGAILLAGHSGNGALLAVRVAAAGIPVSVIYHQARMMDKALFEDGLRAYDVGAIEANQGLQAYGRMLGALRRNEVVFMMADQGVKKAKDGTILRFLGKDMPMPLGPAQLARHAKAPVLPVSAVGFEPQWRFEIQPAVSLNPTASLEAEMAALLRVTEQDILRHPQLWSWHHRRWRRFPLADDGAVAVRP